MLVANIIVTIYMLSRNEQSARLTSNDNLNDYQLICMRAAHASAHINLIAYKMSIIIN